nr:diadenosine tetraphosphate hydrolase [Synechococcus sp. RSCCF101]
MQQLVAGGTESLSTCAICALHASAARDRADIIAEHPLWLLRHHAAPSPLVGWMLLDARRHCPGPAEFSRSEALDWGDAVQASSRLVRQVTGCDRVYAMAFGEGAPHLHLHLIPRHAGAPETEAWAVADLYRSVASGTRACADGDAVANCIQMARTVASQWARPWSTGLTSHQQQQ